VRQVPSVVVVGGGHGCARSLEALRRLEVVRTAVVSVADDGGSSGRLRRDHDVVALGDLRMALLALATEEGGVSTLARRRFQRGELAGHSLGNLLLLGLIEEHGGDLLAALIAFGALTGAAGTVLPATTEPVTLSARTAEGDVAGQVAVATATRIRRVRITPEGAPAAPGVIEAITHADAVLLGPGSLYTSILPVLLVAGVVDAIARSSAHVVLVGNLREQPGETEGMDLADHVDALHDHVPDLRIDTLIAHVPPSGRPALAIDVARIGVRIADVVRADLGSASDGHDPASLATVVAALLGAREYA